MPLSYELTKVALEVGLLNQISDVEGYYPCYITKDIKEKHIKKGDIEYCCWEINNKYKLPVLEYQDFQGILRDRRNIHIEIRYSHRLNKYRYLINDSFESVIKQLVNDLDKREEDIYMYKTYNEALKEAIEQIIFKLKNL